ncbi:MAG TPA: PEGA domain-containing protein [Kofleriaceae bacterium]|nr:PEGA domain-containing protein [Kofleriaceae bacterium]
MQSRWFVVVLAACSSKSEPPPPAPVTQVLADAGVDGITTVVGFDPASGMHLDDDGSSDKPVATRKPKGPAVPIGIMLKSEPRGATVFVDGENIGETPKYWTGSADGSEHEFAFTKPNYALARYRFVPIASGTLHATLERVASGETLDAGLEPIIAPKLAPDAAAPVAPPPTVILPDAAPLREEPRADAAPPPEVDASADPTGPQP